MAQKFCRCESKRFPEEQFYAAPNGVEYHFTSSSLHYTSTCDDVVSGKGPGTLSYKLVLGARLSNEEDKSDLGPAPLTVDEEKNIFEIMPNKSASDLINLLYIADNRLGASQPLPQDIVRVIGDLITNQDRDNLIQLARSGIDISTRIDQNMSRYGLRLSGLNLDLLRDFLIGGIDDLPK